MQICFVRHGETEWNSLGKLQGREDIPLNNAGILQMKKTADYLKSFNWEVIISSPLARAKNSTDIIAREFNNIKILEEYNFIERDYGKASGMTSEERNLHFPDGNWPDVEPSEQLKNRTVKALFKYINEYDGKNIIIVSHGASINSILAYLSKDEIGTGKTILKNACMTLLEWINNEIKIIYYNKTTD